MPDFYTCLLRSNLRDRIALVRLYSPLTRLPLNSIAVQIGAGNIGRGFIAQLFHESGYQTHFVDADRNLVDRLNAADEYSIEFASDPPVPDIRITNFYAHDASELPAVAEALTQACVAAISAGAGAQPHIARMLATGLAERLCDDYPPLNILVCENPPGVASAFQDVVRSHLEPGLVAAFDERIAFVDTVIGRMVPIRAKTEQDRDPLRVRVEPYCELPVDADAIIGELPNVSHLHAESPFAFWIERKLFMHNAAHAAAAYVGNLHGDEYIYQAMRNDAVRNVTQGVLQETATALASQYGQDIDQLNEHAEDLLSRFENPALLDTVARVARDPLRKLSPSERFIRAANSCLGQGVEPRHLAFATAAAIRYDKASDSGAKSVQDMLRAQGWDAVLRDICGVAPTSPFAKLVKESSPATTPENSAPS